MKNEVTKTTSENKYELLEPWIQWATVQTGNIMNTKSLDWVILLIGRSFQIFENLEKSGNQWGHSHLMRKQAEKREFFVPDPGLKLKLAGAIYKKLSFACLNLLIVMPRAK